MARLYLRPGLTAAFAVALAAALSASCARDLPAEIFLQDTWTGYELAAVEEAIAEWNGVGEEHLRPGGPVLRVAGRTADTFDVSDFEDAMHAVYRIAEPTPQYMELENEVGEMDGYGTFSDVLIIAFRLPLPYDCAEETFSAMQPNDDYGEYLAGINPEAFQEHCVESLRSVVLHELGHFLGIAHFTHRPSIMSDSEFPDPTIKHLTEADIEAFCIVYDCR